MKYHAPTKKFTVSVESIERTSRYMLYAIKKIRESNGLDPKGYRREGALKDVDMAELAILDAAKELGVDLGADREGRLDVSDSG